MTRELQDLFAQKGLEDLYKLFAAEDVDTSMVRELTDDDLKEIGLSLGQRKRFRAAIKADTNSEQTTSRMPAERRQLTVAFCDLVGSTALATALDPEDLRKVISSYLDTAVGVMKAHSGYLAYTQGDGLMIYFGYPVAHEDDPARAVRASLATVAAIQGMETLAPEPLNVRIGVATGRVVVGDIVGESAAPRDFVVGETPNLAARMQSLAQPGEVVIAEVTQQLASGVFDFDDRGKFSVKGFDEPLSVFAVKGENTGKSRFDARTVDGVQPIVGRQTELNLLAKNWDKAQAGKGRICLIEGPPGIGKSRLVRSVYSLADGAALEWQCARHLSNRALHPMAAALEREAGIRRGDAEDVRRAKAAALIADISGMSESDLPRLASLAGAPMADDAQLDAQVRARLTLDFLVRRVEGKTHTGPALVALEDAHWADPTSLEFLDLLIEHIPELPILLLVTYRPEFEPSEALISAGEILTLEPLAIDAGIDLVTSIGGTRALDAILARRIIEKTDGVPLFVEELTKAIIDSAPSDGAITADTLDAMDIPATLQDSLMSRLDRTGPSKEIAQLGAVIGREFTATMIRAIAPKDADVDGALLQLEDAELLNRTGLMGPDYFVFNHALVQDTAYESILRSKRQEVHLALARAMLDRHPAFGAQEPETIARHCEVGGLVEDAIEHWTAAGQEAVARAANLAAVNYLQSALRLLSTQPEGKQRDATELGLQMTLAAACMSSFGWGSDSVEKASIRAQELAQVLEDGQSLFGATWIRWTYYFLGGQMHKALEMAQTIRQMAEAVPSGIANVAAAHAQSFTHYSRGEIREAIEAIEWGLPSFDLETDRQMLPVFQLASGNALHTMSANVYWLLGQEAKSEEMRDKALEISAALEHVPNRTHCLHVSSWSLMFSRQWARLRERATMARQIAEDESLLLWIPMCDAYLGVAQIAEGEIEEGLALLDSGLAGMRALGTKLTMSQFEICAADGLVRAGRAEKALER
ncbi:MAG: adenylate/guanylate cyclase domain-containing protein, partial [Boseongicola sp.]